MRIRIGRGYFQIAEWKPGDIIASEDGLQKVILVGGQLDWVRFYRYDESGYGYLRDKFWSQQWTIRDQSNRSEFYSRVLDENGHDCMYQANVPLYNQRILGVQK